MTGCSLHPSLTGGINTMTGHSLHPSLTGDTLIGVYIHSTDHPQLLDTMDRDSSTESGSTWCFDKLVDQANSKSSTSSGQSGGLTTLISIALTNNNILISSAAP